MYGEHHVQPQTNNENPPSDPTFDAVDDFVSFKSPRACPSAALPLSLFPRVHFQTPVLNVSTDITHMDFEETVGGR